MLLFVSGWKNRDGEEQTDILEYLAAIAGMNSLSPEELLIALEELDGDEIEQVIIDEITLTTTQLKKRK